MSYLRRYPNRGVPGLHGCAKCHCCLTGIPTVISNTTPLLCLSTGSASCTLWVIGGRYVGLEQFDGMAGGVYCGRCLGEIESTFVRCIPYERLPLYVNHTWVTFVGRELYWGRLSGGGT